MRLFMRKLKFKLLKHVKLADGPLLIDVKISMLLGLENCTIKPTFRDDNAQPRSRRRKIQEMPSKKRAGHVKRLTTALERQPSYTAWVRFTSAPQ